MSLAPYKALSESIVLLMAPLVEIVIHDLQSNTICFIAGHLSKRKIGSPSLLDRKLLQKEKNLSTIIYSKINVDGRLLRSISLPIEKTHLLCINCDVSIFNQMHLLSEKLLQCSDTEKPKSLFKNDWQEKMHQAIHTIIKEKEWDFHSLRFCQKKEIAHQLFTDGAFTEKNAANYISEALGIGRATLFKYLKEWRGK